MFFLSTPLQYSIFQFLQIASMTFFRLMGVERILNTKSAERHEDRHKKTPLVHF